MIRSVIILYTNNLCLRAHGQESEKTICRGKKISVTHIPNKDWNKGYKEFLQVIKRKDKKPNRENVQMAWVAVIQRICANSQHAYEKMLNIIIP